MTGQIQGGWEYIWAAYAVAWTGLTLYAVSLWARRPRSDSLSGSDPEARE